MTRLAALLATVLAIATPAYSQQEYDIMVFPMAIPCTPPSPDIYQNFEDNTGELPMLRGDAIVGSLDNTDFEVTMEMFVNPNTKNFSIVIYFEQDDMACILTVGKELAPFIQGDEI